MPRKIRTQQDQKISRASISNLLTSPILTPTPPTRLRDKKALEIYTSGIREKIDLGLLVARRISDVTLSGATMNAAGAWLEVGGDGVRVYGDTGEIHWFKDPVPSAGAWMNVWLAGLESGATYVGQIRGFASALPSQQYHIALKVVYPSIRDQLRAADDQIVYRAVCIHHGTAADRHHAERAVLPSIPLTLRRIRRSHQEGVIEIPVETLNLTRKSTGLQRHCWCSSLLRPTRAKVPLESISIL
jgi:hypothetical protein